MKKPSYFLVLIAAMMALPWQNSETKSLSANDAFAKAILAKHNDYRSIAGIPVMSWNKGLAELSDRWAENLQKTNSCKMKHSSSSARKNVAGFSYVGENLYWYWSSNSRPVTTATAEKAVSSWYSEIKYFQYSERGVVCKQRGSGAIGHFTQVMWDKSTSLGCGYAQCGGGTSVVVVCNYGPGGNFNIRNTPPFDAAAARKLNAHPINKAYGGLPFCQ